MDLRGGGLCVDVFVYDVPHMEPIQSVGLWVYRNKVTKSGKVGEPLADAISPRKVLRVSEGGHTLPMGTYLKSLTVPNTSA